MTLYKNIGKDCESPLDGVKSECSECSECKVDHRHRILRESNEDVDRAIETTPAPGQRAHISSVHNTYMVTTLLLLT